MRDNLKMIDDIFNSNNFLLDNSASNQIKTCFIVSSGRTGTLFLTHFFNDFFDNTSAFHEPKPDLFNLGINKYRYGKCEKEIKREILKYRANLINDVKFQKKEVYIESNNNLSLLIPELKTIFPIYKILVITRDIQSYVISAFNKSPDDSGKIFFYAHNDHRKRLKPHDLNDKKYKSIWNKMIRIEKIAWYWKNINEILLNDINEDENILLIKYESLFNQSSFFENILRIVRFFELDEFLLIKTQKEAEKYFKTKRNKTKNYLIKNFSDLANSSKANILNISHDLRNKLGYR